MKDDDKRALVRRFVELVAAGDVAEATEYFAEDAVAYWPQSGERVVGRANLRAVLSQYPGGTPAGTLRGVHVAGELAVSEMLVTYPDGSRWYTVEILEFRDGKIARETSYFGQGFEPPEWRARWVEVEPKEES